VLSQTIARPGQTWTESYSSYDGVNRLTAASEGSAWSQTYGYDNFALAEGAEIGEAATVVHYTSDAGATAITGSGGVLRTGTYVTLPGEIPAGASSGTVEQLLEIGPGKGSNSITFQTPNSNLAGSRERNYDQRRGRSVST